MFKANKSGINLRLIMSPVSTIWCFFFLRSMHKLIIVYLWNDNINMKCLDVYFLENKSANCLKILSAYKGGKKLKYKQ